MKNNSNLGAFLSQICNMALEVFKYRTQAVYTNIML